MIARIMGYQFRILMTSTRTLVIASTRQSVHSVHGYVRIRPMQCFNHQWNQMSRLLYLKFRWRQCFRRSRPSHLAEQRCVSCVCDEAWPWSFPFLLFPELREHGGNGRLHRERSHKDGSRQQHWDKCEPGICLSPCRMCEGPLVVLLSKKSSRKHPCIS